MAKVLKRTNIQKNNLFYFFKLTISNVEFVIHINATIGKDFTIINKYIYKDIFKSLIFLELTILETARQKI